MNKQNTVTGALKQTLNELNINYYNLCFSDLRKNKTAVGVKFVDSYFNPKQANQIIESMTDKGFKFIEYTPSENRNTFSGDRFTFYKREYSI